ncbi:MAG: hypothetical protein FWF75_08770 [Propionibacteriaceae bacterium]|nr:hypothetical protein [Propionibacteriaceae bacterium]
MTPETVHGIDEHDADASSTDQAWSTEIAARIDGFLSGGIEAIPGEQVFAELAARHPENAGVSARPETTL